MSGFVCFPGLAVVVVLHGTYLGTLALLDSKDCVLLTIGGGTSQLLEQKGNALPFFIPKRGAPTVQNTRPFPILSAYAWKRL